MHVLAIARTEPFGLGNEPGRNQSLGIFLRRTAPRDDVPRDLFAYEFVIGLVHVEGIDDVVAIQTCLRNGVVGVFAGGVSVAGEVKPMPSPAFAVARRGEQLIDQLRESLWPRVSDESTCPLPIGRQTGEVKTGAANQRPAIGLADRLQPQFLLPRPNESIDRVSRRLVSRLRNGNLADRLKCPVPTRRLRLHRRFGPHRAGVHPRLEIRNNAIGQLFLRRHRKIWMSPPQRLDQQAILRITGDDGRTAIAARHQVLARV